MPLINKDNENKASSNELDDRVVFMPYILAETAEVIGTFPTTKEIKSKYASITVDSKYRTYINAVDK